MEKDFSTLVSVSGLPGLYRVVANRHNGLIIEDLTNGQKRFAPVRAHQFSLLASIGIYTDDGTEDLQNVFLAMDAHGAPAPDIAVAKDEELRLYFREILPNALSPLVAEMGMRFIFMVLFISTLSFLGLGVQPPMADWGGIVKENKDGIVYGIGAALYPAVAIATLAISVNLVADWILNRTTSLKGGRG